MTEIFVMASRSHAGYADELLLNSSFCHEADESLEGAVVRFLYILGETAGRQLPLDHMVAQAIAAETLA
jgi:hypothetical protein